MSDLQLVGLLIIILVLAGIAIFAKLDHFTKEAPANDSTDHPPPTHTTRATTDYEPNTQDIDRYILANLRNISSSIHKLIGVIAGFGILIVLLLATLVGSALFG